MGEEAWLSRLTERQREMYYRYRPFWPSQYSCPRCDKCLCLTCHPDGPCEAHE